jgi:hypothetical protein
LQRDSDGADNTTLHAKLGVNATENVRLQFVARNVDASAQYDGCFDASFSPSNDCVATTDQATYKVSADVRSGDFTNTFGYSNVDIARDNLTNGVSAFASQGAIDRYEYTGSYKPSDMLTLVYGVDLQKAEVVGSGNGILSQDQDGYYVEYQEALTTPSSSRSAPATTTTRTSALTRAAVQASPTCKSSAAEAPSSIARATAPASGRRACSRCPTTSVRSECCRRPSRRRSRRK